MFWRLMHEAGFTAERLAPESDSVLLDYGYGLTDVVEANSLHYGPNE